MFLQHYPISAMDNVSSNSIRKKESSKRKIPNFKLADAEKSRKRQKICLQHDKFSCCR